MTLEARNFFVPFSAIFYPVALLDRFRPFIHYLLDDGFAFIPRVGELHFHSFQSSFHELAIGRVCQQLVQVLFHCGLGLRSFLTQHVHVLEYEWCLFESNEVVNVSDAISLLNAQLQQ